MNTYEERTRLIMAEIGQIVFDILSVTENFDAFSFILLERLMIEADSEENPARKSILIDAIDMLD